MKPADISWQEWLNQDPPFVAKNDDGSEYIPIGKLEEDLDNFDGWGTGQFKFQITVLGKTVIASGSVTLAVQFNGAGSFNEREMVGAATMQISSDDLNKDYEPTILSFCIANAAKKLGKRFGRALNKRLEKGENANKVIQRKEEMQPDDEFLKVKNQVELCEFREEAFEIMAKNGFSYNVDLKNIAISKPLKSEINGPF